MKSKSLVVVGSSNTDFVIQVPRFPAPGETVLGGKFMTAAGGKGANQAVAAARAGAKVAFVARVGADLNGRQALAGLKRDGIDVRQVGMDRVTASGAALILVSASGENCIAAANGANGTMTPGHIRKAANLIAGAGVLLTQLEVSLASVTAAVDIAHRKGVPIILNPAPGRPLPDALLKKVTYLTPNETECEMLTGIKVGGGEKPARRAAEALLARGVRHVILTLGARGAYVASGELRMLVPGFAVKAIDTTAAGDIFNGAFAVALLEGRELIESVRFAQAAAAISVTRHGAQPSVPRRREIDPFLKKQTAAG